MMATKALITKANGLAMLVALLPLGDPVAELSEAPDEEPAVPVVLAVVSVNATDVVVVTVLGVDKVARLNVVLREMALVIPDPTAPVPTGRVVMLPGMTVVTTGRLLREFTTERSDDTNDDTDAEAAEVIDAAEADVLETDTTEDADTAVADDACSLTDETAADPPVKVNGPEKLTSDWPWLIWKA